MAPTFEHLREADLDDDDFNDDEIDTSDLRERFEVQLEHGYDTFVVVDGLPKVTEDQKPKLIKFLIKSKLSTVGKVREDMIYMPMDDDGNSLRYVPLRPYLLSMFVNVHSWLTILGVQVRIRGVFVSWRSCGRGTAARSDTSR